MANFTLVNYITEVLARINEDRNTANYPDILLINAINTARRQVWNETVRDFSRKHYIRAGTIFDWQYGMFYPLSYDVRYLTEDIATIPQTNIYTDTDGLPSAGYIYIRDNKIQYTSKTSTYLVTATNQNATLWKAGTPILFATALPSNWAEPDKIYSGLDEKRFDIRERVDVYNMAINYYRYMTGGMGTTTYNPFSTRAYCSIEDGFFTGMYGPEGTPIAARYRKTVTDLVNDADVDTIPDGINFIPALAVARIYMERGEEMRGINYNDTYATDEVRSFYKQFRQSQRETQFGKKIYYGDKSNGYGDNPLFNASR